MSGGSVPCDPGNDDLSKIVTKVYEELKCKLFATAREITRDEKIVEDAVQEAFEDLWKDVIRGGKVRHLLYEYNKGNRKPLEDWLTTVVRHKVVDKIRKRKRSPQPLSDGDVSEKGSLFSSERVYGSGSFSCDPHATTERKLDALAIVDAVIEVLNRFRPNVRKVLAEWLRSRTEGKRISIEEIAERNGVARETVQRWIKAFRTLLQKKCKEMGYMGRQELNSILTKEVLQTALRTPELGELDSDAQPERENNNLEEEKDEE